MWFPRLEANPIRQLTVPRACVWCPRHQPQIFMPAFTLLRKDYKLKSHEPPQGLVNSFPHDTECPYKTESCAVQSPTAVPPDSLIVFCLVNSFTQRLLRLSTSTTFLRSQLHSSFLSFKRWPEKNQPHSFRVTLHFLRIGPVSFPKGPNPICVSVLDYPQPPF